ncbi:MAG TPA: 50S ribosomal protein L20 [Clostridiales bacterium]|nr:50S ribosomal protein L20 [Subdoligranulum sp.]PWM86613.1 MAG: 50S ribosomal protein L20 [Subdoligranulum sp.]HCW81527.1 50S ribosomal protein L20 [Clostridiales bacterium]
MMRIKRGVNAVKKRRKILKLAKGYFGAKSKNYRIARQAVMKSFNYAYIGRRLKKRDFRNLWIARINAAARANGMSYSKFMYGLKKANVELNRKVLADIAVNDAQSFAKLVETAKASL